MAESTNIQWADATVNFWVGCEKVSEGCKFCYMYRDFENRYKQDPKVIRRTKDATFLKAITWAEPKRIFTCSYSDFFIEAADEFRAAAWDVIRRTPQHDWMILTKRPERIEQCLPPDWGSKGYQNVWLGTSIENEDRKSRIVDLLSVPAAVHFLSLEPLLGPVNLQRVSLKQDTYMNPLDGTFSNDKLNLSGDLEQKISWVIIGGESGNEIGKYNYRPTEYEWITDIIHQCKEAGTKIFVKQTGVHLAKELKLQYREGGKLEELPAEIQIREFPKVKQLIKK
jgi:protein gp37